MAQIKIVNTVIAIVLQRKPDSVITPLRRVIIITNIGGKLLMVVLCEIAPVMKGNKALPACPNPAIQPIEPARSHCGRIRAASFIATGYQGARTSPRNDAAIAPPTTDGTNHMVSSKLLNIQF